MKGGRRLTWTMGAAFMLNGALPAGLLAVQLGGTINLHTGPVEWDSPGGSDPLLNGAFEASYRTPLMLGLRPELIGEFDLSSGPSESTAFRWDLGMRLHAASATTRAWLGAVIGRAGLESPGHALTRLEGGIRRTLGPAGINLWVSRTTFGAGIVPRGDLGQDSAPPIDTLPRSRVTEYTEVGSRATLELSRYEFGLVVTQRLGNAPLQRTGWELSATWWVASRVGVVGAAGRSLPEFGLTVPGGRYGTVGLRLALGRTPKRDQRATKPEDERDSATAPQLLLSGRRLIIGWPAARRAEVMGDFTDWQPKALLALGGGRWTFPLDLSPGVHHLNVRFDGGAWVVPAGAAAVDDGFGGSVGLIVVR